MRRYSLALFILLLGLSVLACVPRPALAFSPSQMPEAQTGQAYQVAIGVSGNETPVGDMSVAEGSLPAGLTLAYERGSSTATISGTPQEAGQFAFTVSAWCLGTNQAGQAGHQAYTLVVK
jgi:hypothetical protein